MIFSYIFSLSSVVDIQLFQKNWSWAFEGMSYLAYKIQKIY